MTVQYSNSLGLVQVVDCMSHKQPFAAKSGTPDRRNSAKAATGLAGHTDRTSTLTLPCEARFAPRSIIRSVRNWDPV